MKFKLELEEQEPIFGDSKTMVSHLILVFHEFRDFFPANFLKAIKTLVTMAKGIGNGYPMGAVVTTPQIAKVLAQKLHFNTFGGNPIPMVVGKKVLEIIEKENLQKNCLVIGKKIKEGLNQLKVLLFDRFDTILCFFFLFF